MKIVFMYCEGGHSSSSGSTSRSCSSIKEYVKLREDYIHSFIDEHERDVEPEEEE